jgi:hypothetical protein
MLTALPQPDFVYQLVGECCAYDRMNGQMMELGLEIRDIITVKMRQG